MSLLLQALQKAAKSREEGGEVDLSSVDALELEEELALEPTPSPNRSAAESAAAPTSAQAATVVQAGSVPGFDPMDYLREHYMIAFVGGAFLVALAYGTYVYFQINPPFRKTAVAPVLATSAPPPASSASSSSASAKISGLPGAGGAAPAAPEPVPAAAPTTTGAATPPAVAAPVAGGKSPEPSPTAPARAALEPEPIVKPAPAAKTAAPLKLARVAPAPARARRADDSPPLIDASDSVETVVVPTSHAPAPEKKKPGEISVRKDPSGLTAVDPTLMQAYETLQGGDPVKAKGLYEQILQADPRNVDALLGLGAISLNQGRVDDASRYYQRVLELDPRNSYAQAGLISIVGGADTQAAESRLKQLIARDPSAFLYFSLGNLYAEHGQWPSAEQAYYQAFQMQSDNPDYAFNLAIGLEHIGQSRLALDYYRKALDLSFRKGHANFDQSLVIQRVGQLSTRVEQ